jgi:hypothetical protein
MIEHFQDITSSIINITIHNNNNNFIAFQKKQKQKLFNFLKV